MKQLCSLLIAGLSLNASAESWGPASDPKIMGENLIYDFYRLPSAASVPHEGKFWSGDYWPFKKGSINYRWNAPRREREGFDFESPDKRRAFQMGREELSQLSPAEKYDLWTGNYDYPLVREVGMVANQDAKKWEGLCHGWAPASMNHREPEPKLMINPEGLAVPFGSADIKALLSYYYAYGFLVETTHQMGLRCSGGRIFNGNPDCKEDLNAGAFHIVLANKIGVERTGLLADVDRFSQVWNQPLMAYETKVLKDDIEPKRDSAPGTHRILKVRTIIDYVDETDNFWQTVLMSERQIIRSKKFVYYLELDRSGKIIGGDWKGWRRPDFVWMKRKPDYFEGNLARLGELLND